MVNGKAYIKYKHHTSTYHDEIGLYAECRDVHSRFNYSEHNWRGPITLKRKRTLNTLNLEWVSITLLWPSENRWWNLEWQSSRFTIANQKGWFPIWCDKLSMGVGSAYSRVIRIPYIWLGSDWLILLIANHLIWNWDLCCNPDVLTLSKPGTSFLHLPDCSFTMSDLHWTFNLTWLPIHVMKHHTMTIKLGAHPHYSSTSFLKSRI